MRIRELNWYLFDHSLCELRLWEVELLRIFHDVLTEEVENFHDLNNPEESARMRFVAYVIGDGNEYPVKS